MKNLRHIFRKEMRRFFTDKRMLAALFLPGVIIAVFYFLMGNIMTSSAVTSTDVTNSTYVIAYSNNYGSAEKPLLTMAFDTYMQNSDKEKTNKVEYHPFPITALENEKQKVVEGKYDLIIAFSDDFDTAVQAGKGNHLDLYYNGATRQATHVYQIMGSLVRVTYDNYFVNIDAKGQSIPANIAPKDYMGNQIMGIIFPMVTISLLFSTVVSICPDAVAGEKERGTMAAMLLTPIDRKELAIGKALALLVTSLASGAVSFLGIAISLPKMMSGLSFSLDWWAYVLLGFLVLTTLTLFVGIGLLVSTLTKSSKEATSYLGPMTVVFVALAVLSGTVKTGSIGFAFIPFLNVTSCMGMILQGSISIPFFVITIGMSAVLTAVFMFLSTKLFSSEKIMVK